VTTAKRFPLLPDLPSIAESGYPTVVSDAWNGIVVPAGTPKAVIDKLNAEINAVLKMPDVVQKMQAQGFDLVGGTPEQFGALLKGEVDRWAPVIKKVGLKVD
jgi:tripartite-type tricarboxylate transporter receptor subunit TctC